MRGSARRRACARTATARPRSGGRSAWPASDRPTPGGGPDVGGCGGRAATRRTGRAAASPWPHAGHGDLLDVADVGSAASAQHADGREAGAQLLVLLAELLGIAVIELLRLVKLGMAHAGRVGADPSARVDA